MMAVPETDFNRSGRVVTAALGAVVLLSSVVVSSVQASPAAARPSVRVQMAQRLGSPDRLSSGLRTWLAGPPTAAAVVRRAATPSLGSNVDANDPGLDLAAGQSETAIAAQRRGAATLVLAGWNDISGGLADPMTLSGSFTGVGVSGDGGRHFHDLIGLPNNNADQLWSGDPSIAALGDGRHFAVSSLYYPSFRACTDGRPAYGTIAVSIATVDAAGTGARFTAPIPVTLPGDMCTLGGPGQSPDLASLDKGWISYDRSSRTLAVSYTRILISPPPPPPSPPPHTGGSTPGTVAPGEHSGAGQIEVLRATVPADPAKLTSAAFGEPVVVWKEEPHCPAGTPSSETTRCGALNTGAYDAVAPGGNTYVAWERNVSSNLDGGDPFVYLHAALVPARSGTTRIGGPSRPVVISAGQPHGNPAGGVKSLDTVSIAGYSRKSGRDFPRVAMDTHSRRVVFAWNDASLHPLGDIWLRSAPYDLRSLGATARVNDDNTYALHFLPAVSVRSDGTLCTSWYDRRLGGASSTRTDYYADCRKTPSGNTRDVRITTGSTDWAGTSSDINPNFGDYTDNTTDGTHTYFAWSDGRLGIPQPFVDHR